MTQFGRALSELNIEILCANSSQAKGRVERANRTLQDRLVKELRLVGVNDMEAGNAFLPAFMERYNERFAVPSAKTQDLHRPLRTTTPRLNDILCHREQRYVGAQLSSTTTASRSSLSRPKWQRALQASTWSCSITGTSRWKSAGEGTCFPTASSARISASATRR